MCLKILREIFLCHLGYRSIGPAQYSREHEEKVGGSCRNHVKTNEHRLNKIYILSITTILLGYFQAQAYYFSKSSV